jgi:hypothetical protein
MLVERKVGLLRNQNDETMVIAKRECITLENTKVVQYFEKMCLGVQRSQDNKCLLRSVQGCGLPRRAALVHSSHHSPAQPAQLVCRSSRCNPFAHLKRTAEHRHLRTVFLSE